jgi:hypothetical protein
MDILYYSNYCKHSQNILSQLSRVDLNDKISFICIDKRAHDPKTNQIFILLENGKRIIMPPNIHSVPALLLLKENYRVVYGDEIMQKYKNEILSQHETATKQYGGEPMGFHLGDFTTKTSNIVSEQYTYYDMSPEELSAKGKGGMRQLYNYVPATQETFIIQTPPDTYRPDKLANNVTIDSLQKQRGLDVSESQNKPQNLFL